MEEHLSNDVFLSYFVFFNYLLIMQTSLKGLLKKKINYCQYLRGSHISLSWFSCGSSILVDLEFRVLVFVEGAKPEKAEKNPQRNRRTNNKLNPPGPESNLGHTGGRQALSPLPCSPKKHGWWWFRRNNNRRVLHCRKLRKKLLSFCSRRETMNRHYTV